jgi:hypothetical protein
LADVIYELAYISQNNGVIHPDSAFIVALCAALGEVGRGNYGLFSINHVNLGMKQFYQNRLTSQVRDLLLQIVTSSRRIVRLASSHEYAQLSSPSGEFSHRSFYQVPGLPLYPGRHDYYLEFGIIQHAAKPVLECVPPLRGSVQEKNVRIFLRSRDKIL